MAGVLSPAGFPARLAVDSGAWIRPQKRYRRLLLPANELRSFGNLPAHSLIVTMRTLATPADFGWGLGRLSGWKRRMS